MWPVKTKKLLIKVRENCVKYGWCKSAMALDSSKPRRPLIPFDDPGADTFCLLGLIERTAYEENFTNKQRNKVRKKLVEIINKEGRRGIIYYNDIVAESKDDILKVIDKAIENA